jgi:predicted Zn finger-like uncharacterized protein
LIIECPSCHSKYQYDEERFERKPSKRIKCARCQQIFEIQNPAFAESPVAAPRAATHSGDRTSTTPRPDPRPKPAETTEASAIPGAPAAEDVPLKLPERKRLSLAILDGPDAGKVFRIDRPRMTIGRANADLTLNDSEASRHHAAVEVRDTVCSLSDLGSTNGTLFGGEKIEGPVELTDKSEFQVGATVLMLIVTDDH